MKKVRVKTHAANFGEFDCTHVCDFAMSEIASANSKPESISRVYVSVFNERFLIDQDGILYAFVYYLTDMIVHPHTQRF